MGKIDKTVISNDVLCSIPWNHVATKPSGEYRLCCLAKQPESTFYNSSGEVMRLETTPLRESRNSEISKDVRKTMLSGQWHSTCKKCFDEEAAGLRSRRIFYNEAEKDETLFRKMMEKTADDGSIEYEDFPLETFDIRIGNLCNLKCRMCGPIYSSKWYGDYQKLTGDDYFLNSGSKIHFNSEDINKFKWHEKDYFWDEIFSIASTIRHIYMIGGEPLIIKNQVQFLRRLVSEGYAQHIEIEYNSNFTILPDDILEIWTHFKKVTVGISLESIFEENDYIRNPSRFSEIVSNIKRADAFSSPKLRLWITTTFQIQNILSLPKMMDWVEASNFEFINKFPNTPLIHLHPAHTPLCYNIQSLPISVKKYAEQKLLAKIVDLQEKLAATGFLRYDKTIKKLQGIIKFMYKKDHPQGFVEFLEITKKLDLIRKESFSATFPELAKALNYPMDTQAPSPQESSSQL
ncbi:MAG: radical SAM protein [Bdellovibrionaceae bacterium]|nr:radical SAM protein [Pseudobdellovibrionaceae bacterium]